MISLPYGGTEGGPEGPGARSVESSRLSYGREEISSWVVGVGSGWKWIGPGVGSVGLDRAGLGYVPWLGAVGRVRGLFNSVGEFGYAAGTQESLTIGGGYLYGVRGGCFYSKT